MQVRMSISRNSSIQPLDPYTGLSSSVRLVILVAFYALLALLLFLLLFLALLYHLPVIHSRDSNFHSLYNNLPSAYHRVTLQRYKLTVICSLKKSKSSSQFDRLVCAALSLPFSNSSASSIGYDSITFAPSQR